MPSAQQYRRTAREARGAALGALAFEAFFHLPFMGRLRWFLFGTRQPKPKAPTLREVGQAAREERERQATVRDFEMDDQ